MKYLNYVDGIKEAYMATQAQRRATLKYKAANYKQINLQMPKAEYEQLEEYLAKTGEGKATFIRRIIRETIEKESQ